MNALRRLAGWGLATASALLLAALTTQSELGSRRLTAALGAVGRAPPPRHETAPALGRIVEAEAETRRLAHEIRLLHSGRDQLLARIANLERSLDDVTGSIARQASAARPAVPEAVAADPVPDPPPDEPTPLPTMAGWPPRGIGPGYGPPIASGLPKERVGPARN
jgi:hypothetical protein